MFENYFLNQLSRLLKSKLRKEVKGINIEQLFNSWLWRLLTNTVRDMVEPMRDRTADLLRAKQALSQLSYSPVIEVVGLRDSNHRPHPNQGLRSNHLSYRPTSCLSLNLNQGNLCEHSTTSSSLR